MLAYKLLWDLRLSILWFIVHTINFFQQHCNVRVPIDTQMSTLPSRHQPFPPQQPLHTVYQLHLQPFSPPNPTPPNPVSILSKLPQSLRNTNISWSKQKNNCLPNSAVLTVSAPIGSVFLKTENLRINHLSKT